ncbi:CRTAC1 family protein [Tautonia plasticadhaerens]|uniref:CRTAC1 family protein n=1 Tax=Tautonia plasticadhaerens TaxID=2527974 RepID=UPI0018D2145A|nr:CRTAC1 family protein [Tautonia plasticadhaerens]
MGLGLLGVAIPLGWLALDSRVERWSRVSRAIEEARMALEEGRPATARRILARMAGEARGRGDFWLAMGSCELELGRLDRAEEAWARVPPSSPEAGPAAVLRARYLVRQGRLAEAEALLTPELLEAPGEHAVEACHLLATSLKMQGRRDEAVRLYRERFDRLGRPAVVLREIWSLRYETFPIEKVGALLGRANRDAPEDDRVWLGLAHLAILGGRIDDADGWLRRCLGRRPADPAVWRIRLDWALMKADPAAALAAIEHLDDSMLAPADVLELASWFALQRGDDRRRREAIVGALRHDPSRAALLEQLAFLETRRGAGDRASELRARKSGWERDFKEYERLLFDDEPLAHAPELARLALALGWSFESDRWARLVTGGGIGSGTKGEDHPPDSPTVGDLVAELRAVGLGDSDDRSAPEGGLTVFPTFRDRAGEVGLDFRYNPGRVDPGRSLPEMMGGGVALIDVEGDGWLDVYLVQGGPFPPPEDGRNADRLFRNRGDGTFEDVTVAAGLGGLPGGYGFGVVAGDADGDGLSDLFISRWESYQLLRNRGDGTFGDVTESSGLGGSRGWPSSSAFADLDADGDIDLYVCHYLEFDPGSSLAETSGVITADAYNPRRFVAEPDHLFRNDGGRFVDVSGEAGITEADADGRGLGVVSCDFDGDGTLDLYVANDMTGNHLFLNRGGLRFDQVGERSGGSASAEGRYQASMGVACGDLEGDGRPDLAVTNYYGEGAAFYRNLGGGMFAESAAVAGLLTPSRFLLGFGVAFLDANNDGRLDLATANGHVNDFRPETPFAMPAQLLLGSGDGRLVDATGAAGADWAAPRVGRGLAVGDLDNDGRPDVVIVPQDGPIAYLHNETVEAGNSILLRLEARSTATSAEGARVSVEAEGRRQFGWRVGGGSYQSSGDPRLAFGLGVSDRVERIEVRWPSGGVSEYLDLPGGSAWTLREGDSEPIPLPASEPAPARWRAP